VVLPFYRWELAKNFDRIDRLYKLKNVAREFRWEIGDSAPKIC